MDFALKAYVALWATACVSALGLYLARRDKYVISHRGYWHFLTEPWKVVRRYQRSANRKPDLAVNYCPPGDDNLEFVGGHQRAVLPSELEARAKGAAR